MKDLGKTEKQLYDNPTSPGEQKTNKKIYPEIHLPLEVVDGMNLKVDDNVTFTCKGRVSGMEDTRYTKQVSIEAQEGEVKKAGKKGDSILEGA